MDSRGTGRFPVETVKFRSGAKGREELRLVLTLCTGLGVGGKGVDPSCVCALDVNMHTSYIVYSVFGAFFGSLNCVVVCRKSKYVGFPYRFSTRRQQETMRNSLAKKNAGARLLIVCITKCTDSRWMIAAANRVTGGKEGWQTARSRLRTPETPEKAIPLFENALLVQIGRQPTVFNNYPCRNHQKQNGGPWKVGHLQAKDGRRKKKRCRAINQFNPSEIPTFAPPHKQRTFLYASSTYSSSNRLKNRPQPPKPATTG